MTDKKKCSHGKNRGEHCIICSKWHVNLLMTNEGKNLNPGGYNIKEYNILGNNSSLNTEQKAIDYMRNHIISNKSQWFQYTNWIVFRDNRTKQTIRTERPPNYISKPMDHVKSISDKLKF